MEIDLGLNDILNNLELIIKIYMLFFIPNIAIQYNIPES